VIVKIAVIIRNDKDRTIPCQSPSEIPKSMLIYSDNVLLLDFKFFLSYPDLFYRRNLRVEYNSSV